MDEPKAIANLEIIMYPSKERNEVPQRFSLELSGDALYNAAAQLLNMNHADADNGYYFENETTIMWLHGRIKWESEEQRIKYMNKTKFVPFFNNLFPSLPKDK